ncbi:MAG: HAD-IIA family hydrolase [Acutalibacteraceae bacterium]|nr:HAD-IIA family hydrolase [Acutalibacteraceae bacterium]
MDVSVFKNINLYLFDMDGTLYLGDRLYDFTKELLATIKSTGRRYMFMTNNSSKSVADYIKKLEKLGISADREDFITSSQATAYYLKKHHPNAKLYVCGTRSLVKELETEGFTVTENLDEVECIVLGNDQELTFKKLEDICKILLARDLPYIATNPDYVCPTEFGSVPDCGSIIDMLYNSVKKRPVVIGKPEPLMPLLAMERAGYKKHETAVIGDRLYTDVKSGVNAGTVSVLVLSGEATMDDLKNSDVTPDLVLNDCSAITEQIK